MRILIHKKKRILISVLLRILIHRSEDTPTHTHRERERERERESSFAQSTFKNPDT